MKQNQFLSIYSKGFFFLYEFKFQTCWTDKQIEVLSFLNPPPTATPPAIPKKRFHIFQKVGQTSMLSRGSAAKWLAHICKPWKTGPRSGSLGEGNIENIQIQVLSMWMGSLGSLPLPSIEPPGNVGGGAMDHTVTVRRHTSRDFNPVCKY